MVVELAKTAGFCFGVKRAVDTVYEQIEAKTGEDIYTYGPIIHNDEVIKDLGKKGVKVLNSFEELECLQKGTVIIRSHGVAKKVCTLMEEKGISYVDATCPFVKKIHKIVEEKSLQNDQIIIIGNKEHPEVKGIKGWAKNDVFIIQTEQEANCLELAEDKGVCIVAQTTFNYNKFKELVEIIAKKRYDIIVLNTICNATKERQLEAREIASRVKTMIVIGDKKSSNTQKLFEICSNVCQDTYYIQTKDDLDVSRLIGVESVGITAGASTPNKIIEEVRDYVRTGV